ncbi:MAG: putative LPS assembly protein LptD, partial [Bacteroidales bacterium]|nr:putative LPS assembly protein LptD [Bacteroidales bacterium]
MSRQFLTVVSIALMVLSCGETSVLHSGKEGSNSSSLLTTSEQKSGVTLDSQNIVIVDTLKTRRADSVRYITADSSLITFNDSLLVVRGDTTSLLQDSTAVIALSPEDSAARRGSLLYPAFSSARDSIVEDFSDGKRMVYYYGDVSVKYGNLELKSDYMAYDMDTKTVFASGIKDTSGVLQGKPEMTEGTEKYVMETVYYNFESRKARITNMITQESEGFLHGTLLKKMPDNSINIAGGKYTTCDHEHPHFYLQLTNAKVINQPNKVTVFGPAYLVVEDVPTPFALPFGFVPSQVTRASGILIPSFNEEAARGFALKGLGYYFVLSDHLDVTLTTDLFSLGSWNALLTSRYKKRYKYDGNFNLN